MKSSRFQYSYRDNASRLHKKIGDVLRGSSIFGGYNIYQEYPVNQINPSYRNASHKFDWVIPDLYLVIEGHGEQHYRACRFGGVSQEEAAERFIQQKYRDNTKMNAAVEAGYTYLAIPYTDLSIIDDQYIWSMYTKLYNPQQPSKKVDDGARRAKEYRREQYRRAKECLDKIKSRRSHNDPEKTRYTGYNSSSSKKEVENP